MVIALSLSILGSNQQDVRALFAAILYITSALSLALGVILYISAVNDEVSHRRKSITGERDGFRYRYGWAFFFNGVSFIASMVAAVNNISLYLLKPSPNYQFNNANNSNSITSAVISAGLGTRMGLRDSPSEIHALVEQSKSIEGRRSNSNDEEERSLVSMDYRPTKVKSSSSNSELEKSPSRQNEQLLSISDNRVINITTPV